MLNMPDVQVNRGLAFQLLINRFIITPSRKSLLFGQAIKTIKIRFKNILK